MAKWVVLLGITGFLLFGFWALLSPVSMWASMGLVAGADPMVSVELRAFYGGLEIGLAALMIQWFRQTQYHRALQLMAYSMTGLGGARLAALFIAGSSTRVMWIALAIELGAATIAWIALARTGKKP